VRERPAPPSVGGTLTEENKAVVASTADKDIVLVYPAQVDWAPSMEKAVALSHIAGMAYAIYFTDEKTCAVTGECEAIKLEYKKLNAGTLPQPTIFDDEYMRAWFACSIVKGLVKIPLTDEMLRKYERFEPRKNVLIIFAPDGAILKRFQGGNCDGNTIVNYLESEAIPQLRGWQQKQKTAKSVK
jgi:hypothetical protein